MCLAIPGKVLSCEDVGFARSGRVQFGGTVRQVRLARHMARLLKSL